MEACYIINAVMLDSTNDSCSFYYIQTSNQLCLYLKIHKQLQRNFCLCLFRGERKKEQNLCISVELL